MKLNLLIPTLLSTLLSSFYLITTTTIAIASTTATSPIDYDGHEVEQGLKYYITPVQSNSSGGGLSLSPRNGICPPFVAQENTQLSKGLPLRFVPLDTKQSVITLSSDLNIVFNAATVCVQSTVWRLSSGGLGDGGSNDMMVGRRYYVRSGGMVGRPGAATVSDWFRIEKVGEIGYKFVFCPSVCSTCKVVCGDVGVLEENGKKWLGLAQEPLEFMFKKA